MIILKAIGALFICFTGLFYGYKKAFELDERAKIFSCMQSFLRAVLNNIRYKRDNTIKLLPELCAQKEYACLKLCISSVASQQWKEHCTNALLLCKRENSKLIKENEFILFENAVSDIGQVSAQEQENNLEYYINQISALVEASKKDALEKKKLYTGLGLFAGAAVAIILL